MRLAVQETSTDSDAQEQLRTPHEVEELLGDPGELTHEVKSKLAFKKFINFLFHRPTNLKFILYVFIQPVFKCLYLLM